MRKFYPEALNNMYLYRVRDPEHLCILFTPILNIFSGKENSIRTSKKQKLNTVISDMLLGLFSLVNKYYLTLIPSRSFQINFSLLSLKNSPIGKVLLVKHFHLFQNQIYCVTIQTQYLKHSLS